MISFASSIVLPLNVSIIIDVEACDIAHPCPVNAISFILFPSNFNFFNRQHYLNGLGIITEFVLRGMAPTALELLYLYAFALSDLAFKYPRLKAI